MNILLDLGISKIQNYHEFAIFHKPSQTNITINNSSSQPYQYNVTAYADTESDTDSFVSSKLPYRIKQN